MEERVYVKTRGFGRLADYGFLGQTPSLTRCDQGLREWVEEGKPAFILHSDSQGWFLWLTGIPTAREDFSGTPIRCTLVVEGVTVAPERAALWAELLRRHIVGAGHESAEPSPASLGIFLDQQYPSNCIEERLTTRIEPGHDIDMKFGDYLNAYLASLQNEVRKFDVANSGNEAGDRARPWDSLSKIVKRHLEGEHGTVALLNLATEESTIKTSARGRTLIFLPNGNRISLEGKAEEPRVGGEYTGRDESAEKTRPAGLTHKNYRIPSTSSNARKPHPEPHPVAKLFVALVDKLLDEIASLKARIADTETECAAPPGATSENESVKPPNER